MNGDWKDLPDETRSYLDKYLRDLREANEAAPSVQLARDLKKWQAELLGTLPNSASEIPHNDLEVSLHKDDEFWKANLPPIQKPNLSSIAAGSAISFDSTSRAFLFAATAGYLSDPEARSWSATNIQKYVQMQSDQQRIQEVQTLLDKLNAERASEFKEAVLIYQKYRGNLYDQKSVANALRNVLDHFKGDLLATASPASVKKSEQWQTIGNNLAIGEAARQLTKMGDRFRRLRVQLTDVKKGRKAGAATNLDVIFPQWVDYLYSILKLIDPSHFSRESRSSN